MKPCPDYQALETLARIKTVQPGIPVVMITKNEAENLMEEAIGSQIDDYLIKPVNPNQILLTLKKLIDNKRLISEKTATDYQQEFRSILMEINSNPGEIEWVEIYKKSLPGKSESTITIFRNEGNSGYAEKEANKEFSKFIMNNYVNWVQTKQGSIAQSGHHETFRISGIERR